jgi:hypothetical protein
MASRPLPRARVPLAAGLAAVGASALVVRLWGIGAADPGQAEHHKLEALAAWRAGEWIVDGEHPALFKGAAWLATGLLGDGVGALRVPSAVAGAAACVLAVLVGRRLAGPVAGWAAGALLALGTVPVAIDRVGKEDALMLALALGAVLVWLHAEGRPGRWLGVAALAGAAAAAKYEAAPLLPALVLAGRIGLGPRLAPPGVRGGLRVAGAFAAAHLALNPLLLLPAQWEFLWGFTSALAGGTPPPDGTVVPTDGFAAAGEIHQVKPVWYYALYLGVKAQPAWVVLVLAGAALAAARRTRPDLLLLAWGAGYVAAVSLVPFGFARYLAPALPALAILGGLAWQRATAGRPPWVQAGAAAAGVTALALPLAPALPLPSLYVSPLGGGSREALHWTPDDAVGNLGAARAVAFIERAIPAGRVAAADPTLVRFLSGGRLRAVAVEGLAPRPAALRAAGVGSVLVQPSQVSLGNAPLFRWLGRARPATVVRVRGLVVARVYRVGPDGRPYTRTPATSATAGNRARSAASSPGTPLNARPATTAPAPAASRKIASRPRDPEPTRTSEASIAPGGVGRPASAGTRGRSLTTSSPGAVAPRTRSATAARASRSRAPITSRPAMTPGTRRSAPAAAVRAAVRGSRADAARTAAGAERTTR